MTPDIHKKIRQVRRDLDIDQQSIANELGFSRETYRKIELGIKKVDELLLDNIAKAFNINKEEILNAELPTYTFNNKDCVGNNGINEGNIIICNDPNSISEIKSLLSEYQILNEENITKLINAILLTLKKKND